MLRAIILPIFRNTRLCVTACGIMHPRCCRTVPGRQHTTSCNTQSCAPEDGQNNFTKHVELTGIINKPLLLHLVGCLYYLYQWFTLKQLSDKEIYLLIKYIKSVLWREAKRLSYIEDARCLKAKLKASKVPPQQVICGNVCRNKRNMASLELLNQYENWVLKRIHWI